jgi:hypothetical protein
MLTANGLLSVAARIALVLLLGLSFVTVSVDGFSAIPSVSADDDDDDDEGEYDGDDGEDRDEDEGNGGQTGQNGDQKKEKKDKEEKKDKDGEDDDDHDRGRGNDDDDEVVIVAPDVTPVPAPVTPEATATPDAATTGTLRVVSRDCATHPPDGADWKASCIAPTLKASFELEARDGPFKGWHRDLKIVDSGEYSLPELPSGRYALEQKDDDWCRAESDRVDANGELVVEGGQVTTVWIFHCPDVSLGS